MPTEREPGMNFTVWAPGRSRVEACLEDSRHDMTASGGGWWNSTVPEGGEEVDYWFSLDGGPPRPDPRSPWQPYGPEGPSRTLDHSRFVWSDAHWGGTYLPSAVIYECHIGTFSDAGTFEGAIGLLDRLVDLGVSAIELMPVAEGGGDRGWGYDGVDLYAPHHAYGGPEGLKRLVDACHRRSLGVILDVVYNHLGPSGNYLAEFGPYFTSSHKTNWGDGINFDGPDSDEVRAFFIDNALMWLRDYHLDGLRLDAVHAIKDDSATHIVESISEAVHALGSHLAKPLFVVVESDLNDPVFLRSTEAGGYGADATWADEFHHALHGALTGEVNGYYEDFGALSQVATALRRAWVYAGEYSLHRRRIHGRAPTGLGSDRFVVFLQNHDQVGNRAEGERIGAIAGARRAKIGAALTMLSPFVPMLFQGEEWAASTPFQYFTDHQDPELSRSVSEGRRREFSAFGWAPEEVPDPQDPATFARSKLNWSERALPLHAEMLDWYASLIRLRKATPELAAGAACATEICEDEGGRWLTMRRGPILVALNIAGEPALLETPSGDAGCWTLALTSDPSISLRPPEDGLSLLRLPPDSVAVLRASR